MTFLRSIVSGPVAIVRSWFAWADAKRQHREMMTTMMRRISPDPAACEAEPPVALLSSSILGRQRSLPLHLALGAYCCHGGPSAASTRSFNFPALVSNPLHPSFAGRTAHDALECASILTDKTPEAIKRSRFKSNATAKMEGSAQPAKQPTRARSGPFTTKLSESSLQTPSYVPRLRIRQNFSAPPCLRCLV